MHDLIPASVDSSAVEDLCHPPSVIRHPSRVLAWRCNLGFALGLAAACAADEDIFAEDAKLCFKEIESMMECALNGSPKSCVRSCWDEGTCESELGRTFFHCIDDACISWTYNPDQHPDCTSDDRDVIHEYCVGALLAAEVEPPPCMDGTDPPFWWACDELFWWCKDPDRFFGDD